MKELVADIRGCSVCKNILPHAPRPVTLLIGWYAQKHYLGKSAKGTFTDTVWAFREYLPDYMPLAHPSPRNGGWKKHNPWFEEEVIPALRTRVHAVLNEQKRVKIK